MNIETQHLPSSDFLQQLERRVVAFEDVFPLWQTKLWPNRKSVIKPVSPIQPDGSYDPTLLQIAPHFEGLFFQNKLVGTISGYSTSQELFRVRGLYLEPDFRKLGLSQILFNAIAEAAKNTGAKALWSLPRLSAWPSYQRFGFYRITDWTNEGMEFGPNCLAKMDLK